MKDETLESLCARRSIRKYKPDQIASEALEAVLRAGTYAPSGMLSAKLVLPFPP